MVLAETLTALFAMVIGLVALYVSFKRSALMWAVLATVMFLANAIYSGSIPFSTDAAGAVIGTSANAMLLGINLLFALLCLIRSFFVAFEMFKK